MFLIERGRLERIVLLWVAAILALAHACLAEAQTSSQPAPAQQGPGVVWRVCDPPPICFASQQAKEDWATRNQCRFLEDVCEAPPSQDNQGAPDADRGFWGDLWDSVEQGFVYGYKFVKGLMDGLVAQAMDLYDLVTDPLGAVRGLIELGKAFYNDPKGTLQQLVELIGQDLVDTLTRVTQCGAYDLGKVIGQNVNPAALARTGLRLAKYGGKIEDAVRGVRHEPGCASFAEGTPVLTPQGLVPIEQIKVGQAVLSRDDTRMSDAPQTVERLMTREAPGYHVLVTERESFAVTAEHPLWVQGKGWTPVKSIEPADVLAGQLDDVLVLRNDVLDAPLVVRNFSVAQTPNYFVGASGLWAHNANIKCQLPVKKLPAWSPVKCFSPFGRTYDGLDDAGRRRHIREFTEQLRRQEEAINGMDAATFKAARDLFKHGGRNPFASGDQRTAREQFARQLQNRIRDSLLRTMSAESATKKAAELTQDAMRRLAALHEPDNVAGGVFDPIPAGMGDRTVNSQIGRQWQDVIGALDQVAENAVREGQGGASMNVQLRFCRGRP